MVWPSQRLPNVNAAAGICPLTAVLIYIYITFPRIRNTEINVNNCIGEKIQHIRHLAVEAASATTTYTETTEYYSTCNCPPNHTSTHPENGNDECRFVCQVLGCALVEPCIYKCHASITKLHEEFPLQLRLTHRTFSQLTTAVVIHRSSIRRQSSKTSAEVV